METEPEWYDPLLPAPKVGRVLYGPERQRAIDTFMMEFIAERAEETELVGWLVDYVNSYRRRRHGSKARRKPVTAIKERE